MPQRRRRPSAKKLFLWLAAGLVAIQFVPYGRDHANPPVVKEPAWDTPATRELVRRACFDCHSNETRWPLYSRIAPVSWLVQNDVDGGRAHVNFSEWQRTQRHAKDAAEEVRSKEMPLWYYVPLHGEARLTDAERTQLSASFEQMFGPPDPQHDHEH